MQYLLKDLAAHTNWKQQLRQTCRRNGLKPNLAAQLTIIKASQLYQKLQKSYQQLPQKARLIWIQNQLKAFHWVLIVLSFITNLAISQFTAAEWSKLALIFRLKKTVVLKYEAQKLLKLNEKSRKWSQEEDQMLGQLVKDQGSNGKWGEIAKSLYSQSGQKYVRTSKNCRERWLNHLSPQITHAKWSQQEDRTLKREASSHGYRWAHIGRLLNRTEHMVKNRFKWLKKREQGGALSSSQSEQPQIKVIKASNETLSMSNRVIKEQGLIQDEQIIRLAVEDDKPFIFENSVGINMSPCIINTPCEREPSPFTQYINSHLRFQISFTNFFMQNGS